MFLEPVNSGHNKSSPFTIKKNILLYIVAHYTRPCITCGWIDVSIYSHPGSNDIGRSLASWVKWTITLSQNIGAPDEASDGTCNIVIPLPFKDQKSANSVKREMQNLSAKIGVQIKPVFQSKKISQVLSPKEKKPPIVNNSEALEWRHDSDKTQTNKLEWWIILKISLRAKAGVPKTLVKRKLRQYSLYFP